jgi:hypothetical protein
LLWIEDGKKVSAGYLISAYNERLIKGIYLFMLAPAAF